MATFRDLWRKLAGSKNYRKEFVSTLLKRGTAMQIQALMKKKGWTQGQLAKHAGLTQGVISRASNPEYGNLTFNTVIDIAAGFDVAFIGRFVPFSEFAKWVRDMPEEMAFSMPSFDDENKNAPDAPRLREFENAEQGLPSIGNDELAELPKGERRDTSSIREADGTPNEMASQGQKKQPQPEQTGAMPKRTDEQMQMAGD